MWYSERYLQFFAASSHSSGPADLFRRAGPGTGTFTGPMVEVRLLGLVGEECTLVQCPTDLLVLLGVFQAMVGFGGI